jgi:hypothetical protein
VAVAGTAATAATAGIVIVAKPSEEAVPPLVVYIPKVTGPTLVDKDRASVLFSPLLHAPKPIVL